MVASVSGHNTILLKTDYAQFEEGILAVAAYPGTNVVVTTAAEDMGRGTITPGATLAEVAGGGAGASPIGVLYEDALQGKTIHDQLSANQQARYVIPKKGDVLQVRVASGQDIDRMEGLAANASGLWIAATDGAVVQALDDSGGVLAEDTLMRVRVI